MKRSIACSVPLVFLLLLSVVSVRPVWARATLENPQPASSQSGIGVISGWVCNANLIEIVFNETDTWQAGYGTRRTDTQGVCGDTNNGFGLLFNWNLLGDGTHTVRALADGVEFGSATVTVTTLGQEMLRGVSEAVTVTGFPTAGNDIVLRWQESQQNFVITTGSPASGGTSGSPPRVLENPQPGSFQSGIGVISGWVCDAGRIEIEFDNDTANRWQAGYGTRRTDTQGVCGDADNGFGLLFNWNLLGNGTHTVRVLADGVAFANATVTVTTLGQEVLRGASKAVTLPDFPGVGTDSVLQWQEAQQNFVITIAAPTQRLVGVYPDITIPTGVTSVRAGDVSVTSLSSPTGEVRASPDSTLLLAEDAGGTVLLSIANMDGGLLGEMGQGEVEVSLASTAVTLVALAAGYSITAIDQSVVDQITAHANYPALLAAMKTALAADKNFLDRIFDYPEVVRLIRQVATFRTGVRQAARQMHQMLSAQSVAVPPTGIYKDDFWCSPWMGDFSLLSDWLCSPWYEREPWQWFGDAKGLADFYPDTFQEQVRIVAKEAAIGAISVLFTGPFAPVLAAARLGVVTAPIYGELLVEATHPPFLARSDSSNIHATANPNFVAYALELYQDEEFKNWLYTPRNTTMLTKLWNSGAAYREIEAGIRNRLNPSINRVRFERYRFTYSAGGNPRLPDRGLALSFLNTFTAFASVINLFSDVSGLLDFLNELPAEEVYVELAKCGGKLATTFILPEPREGATPEWIVEFVQKNGPSLMQTVRDCILNSQGTKLIFMRKMAQILPEQKIRSILDTVTTLGAPWAKFVFDSANDAVPVFTSYLSPNAGSAEYYIQWEEDAQGNPYIARVSETPPDDKEPLPLAPTNVRVVSVTEDSITLAWDAGQSSVQEYRVYQHPDDGSAPSLIVSTRTTTTTIDELDDGTEYCFSVTAVNGDGSESNPSARVCGTTVFRPVPLDDFHVRLQPGQLRIYLSVRDYGCVDGDEIRVWVNGRVVFSGELSAEPEHVIVSVNEGLNPIEVLALNGTGFKGTCSGYSDANSPAVEVKGLTGGLSPGVSQRLLHRGGSGSWANIIVTVGGSSSLEVRMEDECNDGQATNVRFFEDASGNISQQSAAWPSRDLVYSNNDPGEGSTIFDGVLNCTAGYTVCYGARPRNEGDSYWGVDIDGSKSCDNCCTTCPASGRGEFTRRLICP